MSEQNENLETSVNSYNITSHDDTDRIRSIAKSEMDSHISFIRSTKNESRFLTYPRMVLNQVGYRKGTMTIGSNSGGAGP